MRRTSSRRSISLHPGQNGRCTIIVKIPKSECPDLWIRQPKHKWQKSWSSVGRPSLPLERNLYGHPLQGLSWERQFEKVLSEHGWEKVSNWDCLFVNRQKGLFLSVYMDDIKLAGKKQNIDPIWKVLMKGVHSEEPTSFLDHESLLELLKGNQVQGNLARTSLHGPMTWKDMQRNAWKDIANWQTEQLNSFTKSQHHALTTTNSRKKKLDLSENCQKLAHRWFSNSCISRALVDLILYGP